MPLFPIEGLLKEENPNTRVRSLMTRASELLREARDVMLSMGMTSEQVESAVKRAVLDSFKALGG